MKSKKYHKHRNDLIEALKAVERREKVHIKVVIPYQVAEKLKNFLKEKGILEGQGISTLIQYGLSNESREEFEKIKNEIKSEALNKLWEKYAVTKFKTYEYFMENKAMVMRLSSMLHENRALKRRLKTEGSQKFIFKDRWDSWDDSIVDSYYQKYVFGSRL